MKCENCQFLARVTLRLASHILLCELQFEQRLVPTPSFVVFLARSLFLDVEDGAPCVHFHCVARHCVMVWCTSLLFTVFLEDKNACRNWTRWETIPNMCPSTSGIAQCLWCGLTSNLKIIKPASCLVIASVSVPRCIDVWTLSTPFCQPVLCPEPKWWMFTITNHRLGWPCD